jgi:hypothetical protein
MIARALALFLLALAVPASAHAWGAEAHRYIMTRALDLLPPELEPFFEANRAEVVMRVIDPDLWRVVDWDEAPHHFVDFGVKEYGAYPFHELPRDYDAAVEKFGVATLREYGLLPWRFAEMFGQLRRAFEGFARKAIFAPGNVVLFSAVAAHYIQDAHQPLHASINYDGQQTGQRGVHARFETELFERFHTRLTIQPAAPAPMRAPRDRAFDTLLESYQLVDELLAADKAASAGRQTYDHEYYEAFLRRVQPMLERRLAESITATAALILGAWEQAGRPQPVLRVPQPPQQVRP